MRASCFILLVLVGVMACRNKRKVPDGILDQPKMEAVMWDMMKTGDFLNRFVLFKDTAINNTAESLKWYEKVYQLHHISRSQFKQSFEYYRSHPELMEIIMDSISKKKVITPAPAKPSLSDSLSHRKDPPLVKPVPKLTADSLKKRALRRRRPAIAPSH